MVRTRLWGWGPGWVERGSRGFGWVGGMAPPLLGFATGKKVYHPGDRPPAHTLTNLLRIGLPLRRVRWDSSASKYCHKVVELLYPSYLKLRLFLQMFFCKNLNMP